ncbi:hypothetical protein [Actinophytocola sp.]|uniref:hypothetical protein n=1 Tax=Actinophytocola sp. TaxID=1872138 RepID=UPI002ED4EB54
MKRLAFRDDSGATMVIVLVLVTVLALGLSALMSMSDTSVRTTVGLRDQATDAYAADAAAKVVIDTIRKTDSCAAVTNLPSTFYPAVGSAPAASATVECEEITGDTEGGGANSSPGSAILTLGKGEGGEHGLVVDSSNNQSVKVRGGVFSNSTIFLNGNKSDLENTASNSYVYAMGACTSSGTSKIISTPAAVCNYKNYPQSVYDRRGKDPGTVAAHGASFDAPPAPTAVAVPPVCTGKTVYELQPGLYTSAALLNALTNSASCSDSVFHFNPGRYYFNFQDVAPGTHKWTVSGGYLVAGTATSTLKTTPPPAMPGSCVAPGTAAATETSGVQFVFGGDSRMDYTKNGSNYSNIEICASNSPSGPPIAIYGLKTGIGAGAMAVPAQTGCVVTTPYPSTGACAVIQSYSDPNPRLTIQGTTYTPRSMIDLYLNNNTIQVFRWGLVTRGLQLHSTGSTGSLINPVIDVPDNAPAPFPEPNLMYLKVRVCPGAATCSTSAPVRLRAKVRVFPDEPDNVTVLSWSSDR